MATPLALFLAHAIAFETEAGERYDELADTMETHNNPDVAALFRQMAAYSRLHRDSVRARAEGRDLPGLKSWEYRWTAPEPPEVGPRDKIHYLMHPHHALAFALANELRGYEYYARAAETAEDAEICELAAAFAEEEAEHLALLERRLQSTPPPPPGWYEDTDPAQAAD